MRSVAISIKGKVLGVWFRASIQEVAERLNVKGFVRNEESGNVYSEAHGAPDAIDELIAWCNKGPEQAMVDSVSTSEIKYREYFEFSITR